MWLHRTHLSPCWCCAVSHVTVLFIQVVTLNVALNSKSSALTALLLAVNFVELKASVFKQLKGQGYDRMLREGMTGPPQRMHFRQNKPTSYLSQFSSCVVAVLSFLFRFHGCHAYPYVCTRPFSDAVERFQLLIISVLVTIQNQRTSATTPWYGVLQILVAEVCCRSPHLPCPCLNGAFPP